MPLFEVARLRTGAYQLAVEHTVAVALVVGKLAAGTGVEAWPEVADTEEVQLAVDRGYSQPEPDPTPRVAQLEIVDFGLMDPLTRFTPPS